MNALITISSLLLPVLFASNVRALRWSPTTPKDGEIIYVCADHPVTLAWGYSLDPGDVVINTEWTYEGQSSQEMVAVAVHGNFLPTPAFAHRLQFLPEAGLKLRHMAKDDAGNYSVIVTIRDNDGVSIVLRRSVILRVADDLMTTDHELHAAQQPVAEFNKDTNQWHAVLTCGVFTYPSDPPVWVEWLTPDGQRLNSTLYREGLFQLLLPNPVTDGAYTCRISPFTVNVSCTHGVGQHDSVDVNGWTIRLTLLEAQQQALQAEQQKLLEENAHKDAVISQLAATVQTLRAELMNQSTQVDTVHVDLSRTQTEVRNLSSSLQALTDHTPPPVAFTARLSSSLQLTTGAPLILTNVLVNDGDAYDNTTGRFTAPVDGTYVISAMTTPYGGPQSAGLVLMSNSAVVKSGGHLFASDAYRNEHIQSASLQGAVRLQRGDQVWLVAETNSYYAFDEWTVFSGFLLFVE